MKSKILIVVIFLILLPLQIILAQVDDAALLNQIKAKEEEIKKLEAEEAKFREALSGKQAQSASLKNQLTSIENQLKRLKTDLKITQTKLNKAETNIKLLSRKINDKEKEINNRQKEIAESMRFLARFENQNFVISFLTSAKLSDFLSRGEYLISLESGLYKNLRILSQNRMELSEFLDEEKNTRTELNDLKKEIIIKNRLSENQKKEKNELLQETKNQEVEYQKMISKVQLRQAEIQQEIFELENKLRGQISGIPQAKKGALTWPLLGRITQGYGPTSITGFYNDSYKFHNGIDIAAYYGAPIRAALDGVVAAAGDNGRYAYGKWIAVRHNNGLTTLYTHLSERVANVGTAVKQGEIIGYEGSSGFVTGPHLHFTIYSSNTFKVESRWYGLLPLGGTVNPLDYL